MVDAYQTWICEECGSEHTTQEAAGDCCKPEEVEPEEEE